MEVEDSGQLAILHKGLVYELINHGNKKSDMCPPFSACFEKVGHMSDFSTRLGFLSAIARKSTQ